MYALRELRLLRLDHPLSNLYNRCAVQLLTEVLLPGPLPQVQYFKRALDLQAADQLELEAPGVINLVKALEKVRLAALPAAPGSMAPPTQPQVHASPNLPPTPYDAALQEAAARPPADLLACL